MIRSRFLLVGVLVFAGCAQEGTDVDAPVAVTETAFNAAGAPTVEFDVPDMMCPESCAVTVKEVLAAQPGVKDVRVDFETKSATVAVDEAEFKTEDALAALADRFFVNTTVKSPESHAPAGEHGAIPEPSPAG